MSLYIETKECKTAAEDIVCYKFYVIKDNKILSPYMLIKAPEIGIVATTELDNPVKSIIWNGIKVVHKGFHSYKNLDNVREVIRSLSNSIDADITYEIFKCVIPKGTRYYEGIHNTCKSYCSESIVLKESVEIIEL